MSTGIIAPFYRLGREVPERIEGIRRYYSSSERAARRVPRFLMMPRALQAATVRSIRGIITSQKRPVQAHQTGFLLGNIEFDGRFSVLEEIVSRVLGVSMKLRLDMSSYRIQVPGGYGALTLHQDTVALGVDPLVTPCCVVWMPLCAIDDNTPTLEVAPASPRVMLEHITDDRDYSVLPPGHSEPPLVALTRMNEGDAVLMAGTTMHRTCVKPWHTKMRESVDLRFLPVAK